MAKSCEHPQCLLYVQTRLKQLKEQDHLCTKELTTQAKACPTRLLPLEKLDHHLKEFIQVQQKYFATKLNTQITRYQDIILEKNLYRTLSTYSLTTDLVNIAIQILFLLTIFGFVFY